MRTFDYRHLPHNLFDGKAGDANVRLYQDKGKLELLAQLHPEQLDALRTQAHADTVDCSTRIEGLYVDRTRVLDLIDGAEPLGETEAQIVGLSNALGAIADDAASLDLSTSTIVKFYETLYGYRNLGRKSRYRRNDYQYVQVDGHVEAMPVSPITAFETPLVLGGACDSLGDAFDADACSPLILSAVFTVDFLCIRPFEEGNGRIARLFADLMLEKAGFGIWRYVGIERIIERNAMDYYDALNNCVDKWDRAGNDYTPYVLYWLGILHEAYQELFGKLELMDSANNSKTERVRLFVQRATEPVSKRMIREEFPDISEATVENALGKLVKDGSVEKLGAGRATAYRWVEE